MTNINKNEIITGLKAIADMSDKGNTMEQIEFFFDVAYDQLETAAEMEAFTEGSLALLADIGGRKFKAYKHRRKFLKLLKR